MGRYRENTSSYRSVTEQKLGTFLKLLVTTVGTRDSNQLRNLATKTYINVPMTRRQDDKTSTDPEDFKKNVHVMLRGGGRERRGERGTSIGSTRREKKKRLLICLFCRLKYERPVTTSTLCGMRKNHTPGRLTSL